MPTVQESWASNSGWSLWSKYKRLCPKSWCDSEESKTEPVIVVTFLVKFFGFGICLLFRPFLQFWLNRAVGFHCMVEGCSKWSGLSYCLLCRPFLQFWLNRAVGFHSMVEGYSKRSGLSLLWRACPPWAVLGKLLKNGNILLITYYSTYYSLPKVKLLLITYYFTY